MLKAKIFENPAHHGKIGEMVVLNHLKKSQPITLAINLGTASLNCKETEKIIQNSGKIRCFEYWVLHYTCQWESPWLHGDSH